GLPARADPAVAAVVALRLLLERLHEAAEELVLRKTLELGELFRRELGKVLRVPEPGEDLLRDVVSERALDALEDLQEDLVVRVEVRLALHQARAPEV